jgi:molybdate transport system substrate-binding protein
MTQHKSSMGKRMAKLKVMCGRSMHVVVGALTDAFKRESGHDVELNFATVGAIQKRLDIGETADVLIVGAPALEKMAQAGIVGPATKIATTSVGIAVRDGTTPPDVSTPDAFREALVAARKVAFSDAAVGGSAGIYLAKLFVEMGLGDEIARKGMPQQSGGEVATRVAQGEADIGMTLMAEIMPIKGARIIGPLPAPLGNDTTYAGAVMTASGAKDAAQAFIGALTQASARGAWEAAGFTLP